MSFAQELRAMMDFVHGVSERHGFWEGPQNKGEKIALMHSELSEMLEAVRHGNPPDQHVPQFSSEEIEAADVLIRLFDYCRGFDLDLAGAVIAKNYYNQMRDYKHGKAF